MSNKATLNSVIPVFPASNINESMAFYEKLGFQRTWHDTEYGILKRDSVELHLWKCDDKHIAENTSCRVYVTNIETLYDEYKHQNVIHPNGALTTQPWGLREFAILDLDGNMIKFAEPAE